MANKNKRRKRKVPFENLIFFVVVVVVFKK